MNGSYAETGTPEGNFDFDLSLTIKNLKKAGTYQIKRTPSSGEPEISVQYEEQNSPVNGGVYGKWTSPIVDAESSGTVTITSLSSTKAKGSYQFNAFNAQGDKSTKAISGTFDLTSE